MRDQISRDGVQIPLSSGTMSGESRNARTFDADRLTVRPSSLGILLVSLWLFRVSTTLLILGTRRCMTAREFLWANLSEPSLPETACYRARVATFCNLFRVGSQIQLAVAILGTMGHLCFRTLHQSSLTRVRSKALNPRHLRSLLRTTSPIRRRITSPPFYRHSTQLRHQCLRPTGRLPAAWSWAGAGPVAFFR